MKSFFIWGGISVLLALMVGSGCMGYQLGSSLPPGIEVVHVPVFSNATDEPGLEVVTTRATIAEFQRDGTLSVGEGERADVILEARVTRFSLDPLRYDRDDATGAEEYRMNIQADIQLVERRTGEVLVRRRINGEHDFILTGDLSTAKRTFLPAAAEDLAARIVRASIEFW